MLERVPRSDICNLFSWVYRLISVPSDGLEATRAGVIRPFGQMAPTAIFRSNVDASRRPFIHRCPSSSASAIKSCASKAVLLAGGNLSNMTTAFHSGANNHLVTNANLRRASVTNLGYLDPPDDLVPNVVGLNTENPIKWVRSLVRSPDLRKGGG
jgi:hypothetical protein